MSAKPEAPFKAPDEARRLMRRARWATLATLAPATGAPYASLVTVGTDVDGTPIVLISRLAVHTRNIEADNRVSILFADVGEGDPFVHPRVSVTASAHKVAGDERVQRRFLARHPDAALYVGFADFSFYRLEPTSAHLVAGFGRIVDLPREDLVLDLAEAGDLAAAEQEAVEHVNADHPDTVRLYATALLSLPDGSWRMTGIDPEGCDLACGDLTGRLLFPERVTGPAGLRKAFQILAAQARASQ